MTMLLPLVMLLAQTTAPPDAAAFLSNPLKKVHRDAIVAILEGEAESVSTALHTVAAQDKANEEDFFVLGVAELHTGDVDAAEQALRQALARDLSPGRLLAERNSLLRTFPADRLTALVSNLLPLLHGPMLAQAGPKSMAMWVRTSKEAEVLFEVASAGNSSFLARTAAGKSSADSDYSVVLKISGLEPHSAYTYRVIVDGQEAASGAFRTLPRKGKSTPFTVAFGGGAEYVPENEHQWINILKHSPSAFFFLGDNVYIDAPQHPEAQRYCYYRRQCRPEFRAFTSQIPIFAVWDDHDFSTNDSWGGPEIDSPAWKLPVWRLFQENWANPAYGGGQEHPGVWFSTSISDVDFFLLDSRYYRTDPKGPNPTMLGPVQKQWLKDGLLNSKAIFKVIASPVPFVRGTKGGSLDTWDGYEAERQELLDFLKENRIEGVFVLSADRHRSDVWKMDWAEGYPIYEFESSRLTNMHVHETQPGAVFSYNEKQSFGLLDFDTTLADPQVTYRIVNIDNEVVHEQVVKLSELRFPGSEAQASNAKLRIAQMRGVPVKWDLDANMKTFLEQVEAGAEQDADVFITPECWLDGYAAPDKESTVDRLRGMAQPLEGSAYLDKVAEAARRLNLWICFGFTSLEDGQIYNACGLWDRGGRLTGVYHKTHIQTHDKQFSTGASLPVWPSEWGPLGMMICADRRWPETARTLRVQGAKLILNPTYGMHGEFNLQMMRVRSYENQCFIAFTHPQQSLLVDPGGDILANVEGDAPGVTTTTIDLREATDDNHLLDRRPDLYSPLVETKVSP